MPIAPRKGSLAAIDTAMKRIAMRVAAAIPPVHITEGLTRPEKAVTKLLIRADGAQIKIEVTPVLRGTVYDAELRAVSSAVEEAFGFAEIQLVSFADLYAGKIVAALDRQHPRDLFDVRDLLANEGIDDALRRAFLVYLVSHNRPMAEVLAPKRKSITAEFQHGFEGMTAEPVSLDALSEARESLIASAVGKMPEPHRRFLVSFDRGTPDWALLGVPAAPDLPAVRWRQQNLDSMAPRDRAQLVSELEAVLFGSGKSTTR